MTQLHVLGIDSNQVTAQTACEIIYSNQSTTQAGNCFIWFKSCINPESSGMLPFSFRSQKGDEPAHSLQDLKTAGTRLQTSKPNLSRLITPHHSPPAGPAPAPLPRDQPGRPADREWRLRSAHGQSSITAENFPKSQDHHWNFPKPGATSQVAWFESQTLSRDIQRQKLVLTSILYQHTSTYFTSASNTNVILMVPN